MTPPAAAPGPVPCLISAEEIRARVGELARQISADYAGREVLVVGVLKGAWVFMADLVRLLTIPVVCDFVKLSSYGAGTCTSGEVRLQLDLTVSAEGREVLIVEDVIDTGTCAGWLLDHLRAKRPAGVRTCALLDNPARRLRPVAVDYLGFTIPNLFVVGYGIDWNEQYRGLAYVGFIPGQGEAP
jgi:hypoxanthine phosphoribosyltransferase